MMSTNQSSGSRGKATAPPQPPVNCPRCNSFNTKFCYYNNYSCSQPRHFCKNCKRYWTKGGTLRNVPIGGGLRKSKKSTNKSSSYHDSKDSSGSSSYRLDIGRFKFYDAGSDFQIGGGLENFPGFNISTTTPTAGGQLVSSFGDIPTLPIPSSAISNFGLNPNSETNLSRLMPFNNFPLSFSSPSSIVLKQNLGEYNIGSFNEGLLPEMAPTNGSLASSMESFSSMDQDLHWNLQQERMSKMLIGGSDNSIYQQQNGLIGSTNHLESQTPSEKPQPLLFPNFDFSSTPIGDIRKEINGIVDAATANLTTEWNFGDSSFGPSVNQIPSSTGKGKGIQGWDTIDEYTSLP